MVCSAFLSECSSASARAGISHVCQRSYEKENQQVLLLAQQRQESQPVALLAQLSKIPSCSRVARRSWSRTISSSLTGVALRIIVGVEKYVFLNGLADVAPVILFMLTLVRILYYHHEILRTSPSSLYTCRVFITVNYMQPNLRASEVPGCCRVTCLLRAVIGISTQGLVLESAVIVNGYSPRL